MVTEIPFKKHERQEILDALLLGCKPCPTVDVASENEPTATTLITCYFSQLKNL